MHMDSSWVGYSSSKNDGRMNLKKQKSKKAMSKQVNTNCINKSLKGFPPGNKILKENKQKDIQRINSGPLEMTDQPTANRPL